MGIRSNKSGDDAGRAEAAAAPPSGDPRLAGRRSRRPSLPLWSYVMFTGLAALLVVGVLLALGRGDGDPVTVGGEPAPRVDGLIIRSREGERVPTEAYRNLDGDEVTLEQYLGRPLVVNFWSSTCVHCINEMPEFDEVYQRFQVRDEVAFLGLNINDTEERARELLEKTGVTYDIGRDTRAALFPGFGGKGMPTTALVDERGVIVEVVTGPMSGSELSSLITEKLLS